MKRRDQKRKKERKEKKKEKNLAWGGGGIGLETRAKRRKLGWWDRGGYL